MQRRVLVSIAVLLLAGGLLWFALRGEEAPPLPSVPAPEVEAEAITAPDGTRLTPEQVAALKEQLAALPKDAPEVDESVPDGLEGDGRAEALAVRDVYEPWERGDATIPDDVWDALPPSMNLHRDALGRVCLMDFAGVPRVGVPRSLEGEGERSIDLPDGSRVVETVLDEGLSRTVHRQRPEGAVSVSSRLDWEGELPRSSRVTVSHGALRLTFLEEGTKEGVRTTALVTGPGGESRWSAITNTVEGAAPNPPESPWCVAPELFAD